MATPSYASICAGKDSFVEKCHVTAADFRPRGPNSAGRPSERLTTAIGQLLMTDRCSFDALVCSNSELRFASLDNLPDYPLFLQLLFATSTFFLATIALTANLTVAWIILRHRVMRQRTTNRLVFNLAVSDLSITVFNTLPLGLYNVFNRWLLPHWLCPVNQMLGFCASVFTMVVISIDRYFAILHPLECRPWGTNGNRCCAWTICAIWAIAFLFGAPALFVYDVFDAVDDVFLIRGREVLNWTRTLCDVTAPKRHLFLIYNVSLVLLQFLLPFAVLLFTYGRIAHELCRRRTAQNHLKDSFLRAKRRMAKLFAILVFSFLLLWCPYELLFAVSGELSIGWTPLRFKILLNIIFLLAMSSTIVSPIVYYHMSERFRVGFRYAFRHFLPKSARVSKDEYRQMFALSGPRISLVFRNFHNECVGEGRRRTYETTVESAKGSLQFF